MTEEDRHNKKIEMATAYAEDGVDLASKLKTTLDYSDQSLIRLDSLLETFHSSLPRSSDGNVRSDFEPQIVSRAKCFGCYLGEVIRKNLGGEWHFQGPMTDWKSWTLIVNGIEMWPVRRVYNRIVEGSSNNVKHYYDYVAEHSTKAR